MGRKLEAERSSASLRYGFLEMGTVTFDSSLAAAFSAVSGAIGSELASSSVYIRDSVGRLSIVTPTSLGGAEIAALGQALASQLGGYARPFDLVRDCEGAGAAELLKEAEHATSAQVAGKKLRVLDRRVMGVDWLKAPPSHGGPMPRLVFYSLKGGVGRSTALCIVAAHLSRQGKRVLAIDFDLEAPGIGTMLLGTGELPRFGVLDYLVENGIGGVSQEFLSDMVAGSAVGSRGGKVSVVPALGEQSVRYPENVLAKLSRAYIENAVEDGSYSSLGQQMIALVSAFEKTGDYDIIIIDARAGLHESTPAAVIALGADVLLFGADQPQTTQGYTSLFSHLATLPVPTSGDWRDRFNLVLARAASNAEARAPAYERLAQLYGLLYFPISSDHPIPDLTAGDFDVDWEDDDVVLDDALEDSSASQGDVFVVDDPRFLNFDPLKTPSLLEPEVYGPAFEALLSFVETLLPMDDASELSGRL